MDANVITSLDQVTPAWLTRVLTSQGALAQGEVIAFTVDAGSGNWSHNARLGLRYSAGAQGDCPANLFLKLVNTDTGDGEFFLPAEVTYYTHDYRDVPAAPLIRCYDAHFSAALQRYHVLLDDVSATHTDARDRVPTLAYGLALAEGLAAMHARWWGAAQLAGRKAPWHGAEHIRRFVAVAAPGAPVVLAHLAARLEPHWPAALRAIFANLPDRLVARAQDVTGFTLIHGDLNPANIMAPRVGDRPIYLIDCQPFDWSLTTWLGVYDLAYALALYWETPLRRELEQPILAHYHAQLRRHGVQDYAWDQLMADYRLCVALCVTVAVEYLRGGIQTRWLDFIVGLLQRSLTAYDDHDGEGLWG